MQPPDMIRGIAQAASAMVSRAKQHDATANNMANAQTAGYKRHSIFLRRLTEAEAPGDKPWMRPLEEGNYTDFSQGLLEPTEEPLNLAIEGEGFFVVNTPQGERYTRNGNFTRSQAGEMVTQEGSAVLGDSGPLALPDGDLQVGEKGEVYVDGAQVGKLRIVTFANLQSLESAGQSQFSTTEPAVPATSSTVRQGYVERANFDLVHEMIQMMTTFRYYETAQKAVQMQDETLGRAVNQVGRLPR
jgi:flagellar basal-body rod protein FlgG